MATRSILNMLYTIAVRARQLSPSRFSHYAYIYQSTTWVVLVDSDARPGRNGLFRQCNYRHTPLGSLRAISSAAVLLAAIIVSTPSKAQEVWPTSSAWTSVTPGRWAWIPPGPPQHSSTEESWLGLSEQVFRIDRWRVCRVQAAAICGSLVK